MGDGNRGPGACERVPWNLEGERRERALTLYGVLAETLESRFSYGAFIAVSYEAIEEGTFPKLKPASEKSSHGILKALHLGLATEFYKMTETLGGLCLSAEAPDQYSIDAAWRPNTGEIARFFDGIRPDTPLERVLSFFPYPRPEEMTSDREELRHVSIPLEATSRSALKFLLWLKRQREYLRPFRNKFSHSFNFALFSHPSSNHEGQMFVPLIRADDEAIATGRISERLLLPSRERHLQLAQMLAHVKNFEREVIHARRLWLLNERPVFPAKIWWDGPPSNDLAHLDIVGRVLQRQAYQTEHDGNVKIAPSAELFDRAAAFYTRPWNSEDCSSRLVAAGR